MDAILDVIDSLKRNFGNIGYIPCRQSLLYQRDDFLYFIV